MEPKRSEAAKREFLRAFAVGDFEQLKRLRREIEAAEPEFWRKTGRRILEWNPPLTCGEVADSIVEFATLSLAEAEELMPAVQGHLEFCLDCRCVLELQRRTDIQLPEPPEPPGTSAHRAHAAPPPTRHRPVVDEVRLAALHELAEPFQEHQPGDRLILNGARTAWNWQEGRSPLRDDQRAQHAFAGDWMLLPPPANWQAVAHLAPAAPPIVLAIFPPGLGIEVRATIEPPPPLGENTAWNIRFEADERPGVKLWVEIGTGNEDEAALYQVAPGGGCEFTEPPPEESFYRARFEWTSPAGDGDYTVDLPVSQQP